MATVTVNALAAEVPFRAEKLVTRDGKRVDERRETCWMAEPGVGGLAYSGKIMSPTPFTPAVSAIRDELFEETGEMFDCALLNLYPDGSTACKYHTDPDLGRLWARDSVIVSVGETRRFAFRKLGATDAEAHWFRLRSGDCVHMFADCNDAYEHCVMRAGSPPRLWDILFFYIFYRRLHHHLFQVEATLNPQPSTTLALTCS